MCALVRNDMQRGARCLRVQGRPPSVIARSGATWQSASPAAAQAKRNYSRRIRRSCGFALGIANLLGFPAGLRIATPVCALVRNDMQKGARCLRVQGRPPSVIARSEATWQSASPAAAQAKRNYSRRIRRSCGFALGIANLLGFPAGLRIATPVCALVRNDMQRGARCLRLQGRDLQ